MSATHMPLMIDGEPIGDLITVGGFVSLFTARRDLAPLDGRVFRSADDAREAVQHALSAECASQ
jgi:hypothetical protein